MLEYANELLVRAYEVDGPDLNDDGTPDWYPCHRDDGAPVVKYDSAFSLRTRVAQTVIRLYLRRDGYRAR